MKYSYPKAFLRLLRLQCLMIYALAYLLLFSISAKASNQHYQVYRYISPEGRLVFSAKKKDSSYLRLHKTPQGWVPQNELKYSQQKGNDNSKNYLGHIREAANRYRLPYHLLRAVISVESAYNSQAISHAGAQGLMQLMPATADRLGVKDPFDPQQNIDGGSRYLAYLLTLFNGNLRLALAAYNAGENAVIRHGNRIPPYKETQNYVVKVLATYRKYRFSSQPS